ncbi:MAG: SH3 domain-containing protein [Clostridia bacterium]
MKKALWVALLFVTFVLLMPSASMAEQIIVDSAALKALQDAHPSYSVTAQDQWGDTAAAALSLDGKNILCIAEKQNGTWTVTIDNPTALRQGEQIPSLLLDTDITLFWSYHQNDTLSEYYAIRENGFWGDVGYRFVDSVIDGECDEYFITLKDLGWCKALLTSNRHQDENENLLYQWTDIPIPANWLAASIKLGSFDVESFPKRHYVYHEPICQHAAEQLMPGYVYHGGEINDDSMEFLMEKPDGTLVFVGVAWRESDGWLLTESTALPEGTIYGYDCYETSLYLPQKLIVEMKRSADGTWGIAYVTSNGRDFLFFGSCWIARDFNAMEDRHFGDHPWGDMTKLDWNTLPVDMEDALKSMDNSAWAVVNNANPEDRLHLRTEPSKDAASLGKYYNGTPVHVLSEQGEWVKVALFGVEGWMLRRFLAFGEDMNTVKNAYPFLVIRPGAYQIYGSPDTSNVLYADHMEWDSEDMDMRMIGVVGDTWYHVWYAYSGRSGYLLQSDMCPG